MLSFQGRKGQGRAQGTARGRITGRASTWAQPSLLRSVPRNLQNFPFSIHDTVRSNRNRTPEQEGMIYYECKRWLGHRSHKKQKRYTAVELPG